MTEGPARPANGPVRVFISYAREDFAAAMAVETALTSRGYVVDRDVTRLGPGTDFSDAIRHMITTSDAVVVLWSKTSVSSKWVRAEAQEVFDTAKYAPLDIDGVSRLPLPFTAVHTPVVRPSDVDAVLRELLKVLPAAPRPVVPHRSGAPSKDAKPAAVRVRTVAAVALVAALAVGAYVWPDSRPEAPETPVRSVHADAAPLDAAASPAPLADLVPMVAIPAGSFTMGSPPRRARPRRR